MQQQIAHSGLLGPAHSLEGSLTGAEVPPPTRSTQCSTLYHEYDSYKNQPLDKWAKESLGCLLVYFVCEIGVMVK